MIALGVDGDTPALAALRSAGLPHDVVRTGRVDSVEAAAEARGITVAALIKTIVVRLADGEYVFVLVPGDRAIDWAKLRASLGVRRAALPDATEALDATGYERGAITPFGSKVAWPVVMDSSLLGHDVVSLGGGARGVSVRVDPHVIARALDARIADATRAM